VEDDDDDDGNLLDSHTEPLNNEELELDQLTLEKTTSAAAADNDEDEIHRERGLTLNSLREIFEKADQIADYFKDKCHSYH
jgi:hypothetical protein